MPIIIIRMIQLRTNTELLCLLCQLHHRQQQLDSPVSYCGRAKIPCSLLSFPTARSESIASAGGQEVWRSRSTYLSRGATVKPVDILVGKVTQKGETQLTAEEKLLRAIFGEKAGDVRDAQPD